MEFKINQYTYDEMSNIDSLEGDDYGLMNKSYNECRRKILFENPNLHDMSSIAANYAIADNKIVGYLYSFPTKFKAGDNIFNSMGATALEVHEDYRKSAIGAELVMAPMSYKNTDALVYADASDDGMACYHALRYVDFAMPKLIQITSARFLLNKLGIIGIAQTIVASIINCILKPYITISRTIMKKSVNDYSVKRLTKVPEWIDDMVLNDGHKYMEIHDHKWMQWCLDNCFFEYEEIPNYFYAIYDAQEKPVGFFLIKERDIILENDTKTTYFGTLMEWGTSDCNIIDEYAITKMAISKFSNKTDVIRFATLDNSIIKRFRKYGFFKHGFHHIVFKDLKKQFKDAKNPDLWRLRFGYNDSIMN